jgi:hypothetical protein
LNKFAKYAAATSVSIFLMSLNIEATLLSFEDKRGSEGVMQRSIQRLQGAPVDLVDRKLQP